MYLPNHFVEHSRERLIQTIREWPLATIIRMNSDGLTADHVPLVVVEEVDGLRLQGHVRRANPIGDDGVAASTVLVIFHGPEAYISPSWYPAKTGTRTCRTHLELSCRAGPWSVAGHS